MPFDSVYFHVSQYLYLQFFGKSAPKAAAKPDVHSVMVMKVTTAE